MRDAQLLLGEVGEVLRVHEGELRGRHRRLGAKHVGLRRVADGKLVARIAKVRALIVERLHRDDDAPSRPQPSVVGDHRSAIGGRVARAPAMSQLAASRECVADE